MKLNQTQNRNLNPFQVRLQQQPGARSRAALVSVDRLLMQPEVEQADLFKSVEAPRRRREFASVDELVVSGNQAFDELDNIDFAGFRNDKDLAEKMLKEARRELKKLHPEGEGEPFQRDLRRVLHARYLQGHGVQVQSHLDDTELAGLRRYVQAQSSGMNVADAVRSINSALQNGEEAVPALLLEAERGLFRERGVKDEIFENRLAPLGVQGLGALRDFADSWAVAEGGKYLNQVQGQSLEEMRQNMTRQLLDSDGYLTQGLDSTTALSLLRDRSSEGPPTNATLAESINEAIRSGETDYFKLNQAGNEGILAELGVAADDFAVSDKALVEAYPDVKPAEARAERTRVLRDLLRVLPDSEREAAIAHLSGEEADLISAEGVLHKYLGERIRDYSGYVTGYGDMDTMQRANLTSGLSRLPEDVRFQAFHGGNAGTLDSLQAAIEDTYGVTVHREAGVSPRDNESYAPFVKDWTVQGLVDLFNALTSMSKDGKLPEDLKGVVLSFMEGSPKSPSMTPVELKGLLPEPETFDRPGAYSYTEGQSGFFGECDQDEKGHDGVVLYDDSLYGPNGDSAVGLTQAEATLIHELGHAIQLGGTPGAPKKQREIEDAQRMAEWSSLSGWREPGGALADGRMGDFEYYYDPSVQVDRRDQVATSYGASDPCEDFAEFTPWFFKDPGTAMGLSAEKFLYYNRLVGDHYSQEQVERLAQDAGLAPQELAAAATRMREKVALAPEQAGIIAG
ncbi:hypothetical protein ABS71_06415 [bacterium SCN 62-11]|nr:hypothetical protein [Candidatus Eremiobacteraeota bacterium]ODT73882.1 MAG: hypothetical protein ABS71_06415 [bacterium SCN 62-11]